MPNPNEFSEGSAAILVADDNDYHRQALALLLRAEGHRVVTVDCGDAAVVEALRQSPDLVILDVEMPPGIDGFETCRRLHELLSPPPSVLFLSGHTQVDNTVRGLDVGGIDYIAKPYDSDDLTARVRAAIRVRREIDHLRVRGTHDPLTGLLNRSELESRLLSLIALGERTQRPFGCLIVDMDCFKDINDTYGHLMGDVVLKETSDRLVEACREADSVFRMGGDELAVLAPDTQLSDATRLAERIRRAVSGHTIIMRSLAGEEVDQNVSISVGVTAWQPGTSASELLRSADGALYEAKRLGGNRVHVSS